VTVTQNDSGYINPLLLVKLVSGMKITVKLGGFLFATNLDTGRVKVFAEVIKKLHLEGHRLVVVSGGGENARRYVEAARKLGAAESICDQIGIYVSRLNARLLISALGGEAFPEVPGNIEELNCSLNSDRIIVLGGLQPGHSTNAVAAIAAETFRANLMVNVSDVSGVYTEDPKKSREAKLLKEVSARRLLEMAVSNRIYAGSYELADPVAIAVMLRSRIPTWFISGDDPTNIEKVVKGEHVGTEVIYE